jgi:hypothetical protein
LYAFLGPLYEASLVDGFVISHTQLPGTGTDTVFKERQKLLGGNQRFQELDHGIAQVRKINELFEKQARIEVGSVPLLRSMNDIHQRGMALGGRA